jgi:hypothetical protein
MTKKIEIPLPPLLCKITVNDAIVFYFLSKNKNVKKCASGG